MQVSDPGPSSQASCVSTPTASPTASPSVTKKELKTAASQLDSISDSGMANLLGEFRLL